MYACKNISTSFYVFVKVALGARIISVRSSLSFHVTFVYLVLTQHHEDKLLKISLNRQVQGKEHDEVLVKDKPVIDRQQK